MLHKEQRHNNVRYVDTKPHLLWSRTWINAVSYLIKVVPLLMVPVFVMTATTRNMRP